MNAISFNFFTDLLDDAITKLATYFERPVSEIKYALHYGCSTESFIDDLKIDLSAFDSNNIFITGRHLTTSTVENLKTYTQNGLLDLAGALTAPTPLFFFLKKHGIYIDVENEKIQIMNRTYPIEQGKEYNHHCFMGRNSICSWFFGCEALQKMKILYAKLYEDGATIEFFISGSLEEMLDYSVISKCPEILDTIDQIVSAIHNPSGNCSYTLCRNWASIDHECYVFEFDNALSDMETYNPINYDDAYEEIYKCFKWSNISSDDYYQRVVPKRIFDNRFLIDRIISIYIYQMSEQYGSLLPEMTIPPERLAIYRVQNNNLEKVY